MTSTTLPLRESCFSTPSGMISRRRAGADANSAVAEAWVASDRKHLYASSDGLGQSFSFDMLMCNYNCKEFKDTIAQSLKDSQATDGSTTWVFSS